MSILEYFTKKRVGSLPNPQGTLSNIIPSVAITESANSEVKKVINQGNSVSPQISRKGSRKGKKLRIYSPRE